MKRMACYRNLWIKGNVLQHVSAYVCATFAGDIHCHLVCANFHSLPCVSEMAWVRLSNGEVTRTKLKTRKGDESADSRRNENIIPNGTSHHEKVRNSRVTSIAESKVI